ncbi:hypothetical protein [Flavobacterium subsaxonicum]|uniref:DUF4468 domain-containing protein n=1 Tax=Flavobacterium subsaxonicum WB 4.1-42 = DSM 21790 TaxID=1121898 RepID=A0A0A2MUJ0_9FLAO|nr:hypothetical protein [Flavobacterium subsaxonicum]KGO91890.1 hypothetical protein Q766_15730 [Flavobacterium subsaxonicum WB 4.1-42 = DSM 21790]
MKKLFLLFFLIPALSCAQDKIFSVVQIDSIANKNGNSLHDSYSNIKVEKKRFLWGKKTIATGSGKNSLYEYDDRTKRKTIVVKATYLEKINYFDNHSKQILIEFYYNLHMLFFVRVTNSTVDKKANKLDTVYEIDPEKEISKDITKAFEFDIKQLIFSKNEDYQKYFNYVNTK